jgi:hypothetical protein
MLYHSVRRVPLPSGSSSHRRSLPPQLYSSSLGPLHGGPRDLWRRRPDRRELHRPHGGQVPIGVERHPFGQVRRIGERLPHHRRLYVKSRLSGKAAADRRQVPKLFPYGKRYGRDLR